MIYFDNAATTWPKPESVYQAMDKFMREQTANPGRAGHRMAVQAGQLIFRTRELVAELFNAVSSQEIIFTKNATEALNLAIKGSLQVGDHVITTSMAHNSILRPLKELEDKGVEVSIIKADLTGQVKVADIQSAIQSNTKLVVMTHASNVTGTLLPIAKVGNLLADTEINFLVDAAQTAGVYPIDVQQLKIDMLAFTGHKGLFGPQGIGGLYLKQNIDLEPLLVGGTGSNSEDIYQPQVRPDKYESGTPNTVGIAGLKAGIEFIMEEGLNKIRAHEQELMGYLINKIEDLSQLNLYRPKNINDQVPVLSINFGEETSGEIGYILDKAFNIAVRTGLHCAPLAHKSIGTFEKGTVRFSLGYFNTKDDLEKLSKIINKIVAEL